MPTVQYHLFTNSPRACLKKAFCKMCVTICRRFCSDEGIVAGYDNLIRAKYTTKWGVQIAGMIFQTRSRLIFFTGSLVNSKYLFPYLYSKFAYLSKIIYVLLNFKYIINSNTLILYVIYNSMLYMIDCQC